MAYRYGIYNKFRPSELAPKAYGWVPGANYNAADVPYKWVNDLGSASSEVLQQQFAYEWFQSSDMVGFGGMHYSNPPFVSGAAGRLHPLLLDEHGKPARILRGYIRRADYEVADPMSKTRLYFMYNPETITRDYVSYLEQSALDPFNTVYQSGNLIAPPSIMNFSFELFFDRQEEAASPKHPGVFVDYQFFDMVVRNVTPSSTDQMNSTLVDNGVMMVNPRDITVIFSPQLTVQGRPTNAQVMFEKFTHRMTPTRMRIRLTILASYFGPVKDMVEYHSEELQAEDQIPIDEFEESVFNISWENIDSSADAYNNGGEGSATVQYGNQILQSNDGNHTIRLQALAWAYDNVVQGTGPAGLLDPLWTNYVAKDGKGRIDIPRSTDCSGLITQAYAGINQAEKLGWKEHPGTSRMIEIASGNREKFYFTELKKINWRTDLMPGDILISDSHVSFFVKYQSDDGSGKMVVFDAQSDTASPEVGERTRAGIGNNLVYLMRPTPLGHLSSASQAPRYNTTPPASYVGAGAGVISFDQTVVVMTGRGNQNIRLAPAAVPAWEAWRKAWGREIPCTSGWRDPIQQENSYKSDPNRFAPASKSYHCKGLAVDVDNTWLGALSKADQSKLRQAARSTGWGQCRWRKITGPVAGYECPCNWDRGTVINEPWHFSYGGCG